MNASRGFTLMEMAIVLALVGLILGGLLVPLKTQFEVKHIQETQDQLEEIKEALIAFAIANDNRLPCPADDADDGVAEDPPCADTEGYVPWATLGLEVNDAWGRPFLYRADDNYTPLAGVPNPPDTSGDIDIDDFDGNDLTVSLAQNRPAAIIISCGENAILDQQNDDDGDDDCTNSTSDGTYTSDVIREGEFDDIVIWVSKHTLLSRLVMAQTWP